LTVERQIREIRFIEVKCGRSRLTSVQRSLREAVEKQRVFTEVWEIGNPDIAINKATLQSLSPRISASARR